MKLKTSHILIGAVVLIALSQGENVRSNVEKGNRIKQEQSQFSDRIRRNRTEAKNAQKLSKVALDRYRANCIMVVDKETGQESYFQVGSPVIDTKLGRELRSGAPICNKIGDTGVVSEAGTVTDIARVAIPDQAEFNKLLQQRR